MGTIVGKIKDLEFNELVTLAIIEKNDDLREIFNSEINLPFTILYRLQKENKLNDATKKLLVTIFEKVILTKQEFIDKYLRLVNSEPEPTPEPTIELPLVEEVKIVTPKPKISKPIIVKEEVKENKLPRRYGKQNILKDIERQGTKPTQLQSAMLKVNDLKNIYVTLSSKGVKDMLSGTKNLSDEECREIISTIILVERRLKGILKKKK